MDTTGILVSLILTVVLIPLSALLLMLTTMMFKLSDKSYKTAIKITLIIGVVRFVLDLIAKLIENTAVSLTIGVISFIGVSIVLALFLVKNNYNLEWGKAALVWLVWLVLSIILYLIIAFIVGIVLLAVGLGALAAAGGAGALQGGFA